MPGVFKEDDLDKIVEAAARFRERDGRINRTALARELNRPSSSLQRPLQYLHQIGRLQSPGVLPGFEIKSLSTQQDADGNVEKTFIKQAPERGPELQIPEGHLIKGQSALVDGEGRVIQQWVKTKAGELDPLWVASQLTSHFDKWKPSYKPEKRAAAGIRDQLAFYPVSDLHVGLMAWNAETGEDWDLRIAKASILATYQTLFDRTPATDQAAITFLGDNQHSDFYSNITEQSGNVLDVDGRFPKVLMVLCETAVEIIRIARAKHRRVYVRTLGGNHDRHSAVALSYFLLAWFRNDPSVTVDTSPAKIWVHEFGKSLICATHGDTLKPKDMPGKIAAAYPEAWGRTLYRYGHGGHVHHDEARDWGGLKVESHAIIAPSDAYHAAGPYHAFRNAKSIVYDAAYGEVGRSIVNVTKQPEKPRNANRSVRPDRKPSPMRKPSRSVHRRGKGKSSRRV